MDQLKAFFLFFIVVVLMLVAYIVLKKEQEETKPKEPEPFKPEGFGLSMILPETCCDHYCS